jgi:hypothetical protein
MMLKVGPRGKHDEQSEEAITKPETRLDGPEHSPVGKHPVLLETRRTRCANRVVTRFNLKGIASSPRRASRMVP